MLQQHLIISGSRDSTIKVWRLPQPSDRPTYEDSSTSNNANSYLLRDLTGHQGSIRAVAAHGDIIISGSYDCTVRVWKTSTGETAHHLIGHTEKIYCVALDHENKRCFSGSMDNDVRVWCLKTGTCLFTLKGHTSLVGILEYNHRLLISAAPDGTLRIWNPNDGTCQSILSGHTKAITCFQHDDQKIISGSDRTLKMWNIKTGESSDILSDLSGVWQVRFDGKRCVAAVQRNNLTYIEVLEFGVVREGIPETSQGHRVLVNELGHEIEVF
ncbi:WD40 repeat-like protein [Aureobasidium subglaciale]|nr:WD40 repeat-like protein [Aureobasidium subglaciale]